VHSCWAGFDVEGMWEGLNKLTAAIAAEREAKGGADGH
jgi:hypothetical protein